MIEPLQLFKDAIALQNAGQFADAVAKYDEFLLGYVGNAQIHTNRGIALFELGRMDEAIAAYQAAVQSDEDYADAHYSMGLALFLQHRYEEAIVSFDHAILLAPSPHVYISRGAAWFELEQFEEALSDYDEALRLDPHFAKAHANRGLAFHELGQLDAALACFERSLFLSPSDHSAEWNQSRSLLRVGNFNLGWQRYERRLEGSLSQPLMRERYGKPRYFGVESLAGKTILLWPEQGHGDVIQFCRYAFEIERKGAKVIVEAYSSLVRLFQIAFMNTSIRVALDGATSSSEFDFHSPLLSLPLACGTNEAREIPADIPYLFAAPEDIQIWKQAMPHKELTKTLRVGLVWAGGHRPNQPIDAKVDAARSLRLAQFASLIALTQTMRVQFFSLQMGEPAQQLKMMQGASMVDLTGSISDWADTAALIANLDLVITCCTAVAHLAAAMGRPTWVLLHDRACWRWLQNRDDSPWYPTVRLFRQKTRGDWESVIKEVALALDSYNG